MGQDQKAAAREWKANWPIVVGATAGITFSPVPTASMGFFIDPLHAQFGWTVAAISSGLTIQSIASTFLTPVAGGLADRFGARWVATPSIFMAALAFAAISQVTGAAWQWTAIWIVYSLVSLGTRSAVWSAAISKSFAANRGLALGIVLAGLAVTQAVAPIVARWLIDNHGWRTGYLGLGLGWGGLVAMAVLLLFRPPKDGSPATPDAATHRPTLLGGLTLPQAIVDHRVLRIALAILLQSIAGGAVNVHLVKILGAHGISRSDSAMVAAVYGIATVIGQVSVGRLLDRYTSRLIPFACFTTPALAYLLLAQGSSLLWPAFLAAILIGLGGGASLAAAAYLTSRYAGVLHYGKIFGIISSMLGLAGGLGPLLAGHIFDATGSYALLLSTSIGLVLVSGFSVLGLGPYPNFLPVQDDESKQA
jgi:MFS family permease